jgi:hypothetical protein
MQTREIFRARKGELTIFGNLISDGLPCTEYACNENDIPDRSMKQARQLATSRLIVHLLPDQSCETGQFAGISLRLKRSDRAKDSRRIADFWGPIWVGLGISQLRQAAKFVMQPQGGVRGKFELAENHRTFQAQRAQRAKRFANALVSGIPYRRQLPSLTDN